MGIDNTPRKISRAQEWYGLKGTIKKAVKYVPGYNSVMRKVVRAFPGKRWVMRLPVAPTDVEVIVGNQRLVMVSPDRCEIAKGLWWSNGVRAPKEDAVALELFWHLSREANYILDVGSNSGLFSVVAAQSNPDAKVFAFDLLPEAVEFCFSNIVRNNCATQVVPLLAGIGEPDTSFRVPARVGSSSLPSSISTDFSFDDGVDVPIVSLDSIGQFLPENASVLMKIDVEATEDKIFEYGQDFLHRFRPTMLCEILSRAKVDRFSTMLSDLGYSFHLITPDGLSRRESLLPDASFKDWIFSLEAKPE